MVDQKASALLEDESVQVVGRFLPPYAKLGGPDNGMPIHQYLLNLTRHTPRNMLRLFENLRLAATDLGLDADGRISQRVLREGALRYANRYFVDAVRNELVGRSSDVDEATAGLNAFRVWERANSSRTMSLASGSGASQRTMRLSALLRCCVGSSSQARSVTSRRGAGRATSNSFTVETTTKSTSRVRWYSIRALVYAWAIPRRGGKAKGQNTGKGSGNVPARQRAAPGGEDSTRRRRPRSGRGPRSPT